MRKIAIHQAVAFLSMLALATIGLNEVGQVLAQQPAGDGHADHDHGDHDHLSHLHSAESVAVGPNGGHLSTAGDFQLEVVYSPNDIHIFAYDSGRQPVVVRGAVGEMLMQVTGVDQEFKFPLGYAQMINAQGQPQDVLGSQLEISRIRDGEMQVQFLIKGLPSQTTPSVRFEQTFAITRPVGASARQPVTAPPTNLAQSLNVTVAALTAADQAGVVRQKICPVKDTPLGDHGNPIKLMVGSNPLYVCCTGCIRKVQQNPQAYLAKAQQPNVMSRSADGHAGHNH